jgi:hypothetical protein
MKDTMDFADEKFSKLTTKVADDVGDIKPKGLTDEVKKLNRKTPHPRASDAWPRGIKFPISLHYCPVNCF